MINIEDYTKIQFGLLNTGECFKLGDDFLYCS